MSNYANGGFIEPQGNPNPVWATVHPGEVVITRRDMDRMGFGKPT